MDDTKTPNGSVQDISTLEKFRPLSQTIARHNYPNPECRPASSKPNGREDLQRRAATVAPNSPAPGDRVIPIAIIGMSCRYPGGASDIEKLSDLVSEGRSTRLRVPEDRFNVDAFYHPHAERIDTVSHGKSLNLVFLHQAC